jgi:hypothetical protein
MSLDLIERILRRDEERNLRKRVLNEENEEDKWAVFLLFF